MNLHHRIDDSLGTSLAALVPALHRRARAIVLVNVLLTIGLAVYTVARLGVNMDNKRMLADDLPFQRAAAQFRCYFPSLDDSLLVVVDAETPVQARESARRLAKRLHARKESFSDVYVPGASEFFERRGLLYRSPAELDDFVDHLARMQPVIAELSRDPSIANLARLIRFGLEEQRENGAGDEAQWSAVLDRVGDATVDVFEDYPVRVSWEDLILQGSALDQMKRQVVVAEPKLEFGRLLAAHDAIQEIRDAAAQLNLTAERGVRVRITGNPALNYEEMLNLAWDIGYSGIFSFVLVTILVAVAFRSLRLVIAAATTLLIGLVWTAAFATAAIGSLNVVSIAFGVLFIGLGIDFAIHLGMHYADRAHAGVASREALRRAVRQTGGSLVLCAVTTALAFYAFVPTEYRGIGELGLIAGTGMFVIFAQTLIFFPAMISLLVREGAETPLHDLPHLRLTPPRAVARHAGLVVAVAAVLGLAAASSLPELRFDANVVRLRDPRTESVQAFNDLLAASRTSPWYADVLERDLDAAERAAATLERLPVVDHAITLRDYVPADQEEKIDILADAAFLLDTPPAATGGPAPLSEAEQVAALRELHDVLAAPWLARRESKLAASARQLRDELDVFLRRSEEEGNVGQALAELESVLLGNFDAQVRRLRRALEPDPITLDDLPADLRHRMLAPDGHSRVQVFPRDNLRDNEALAAFVDQVRSVEPDATGVAVNILEFARATSDSLRQALISAYAAIALLLLLLWRRVVDTFLVLVPLSLGAVLTGAAMVALDVPFNFANVIVLPLLLGIGVDSGIHLVTRSRFPTEHGELLETTTARAVFFSALTTIASFGSLVFAGHRGVASMGVLLVIGMFFTLACNLVVLPALLALRLRAASAQRGAALGGDQVER